MHGPGPGNPLQPWFTPPEALQGGHVGEATGWVLIGTTFLGAALAAALAWGG